MAESKMEPRLEREVVEVDVDIVARENEWLVRDVRSMGKQHSRPNIPIRLYTALFSPSPVAVGGRVAVTVTHNSHKKSSRERITGRNRTHGTTLQTRACGLMTGLHQEIGRILLRPCELISSVVSGYERHNLSTSLYWACYAS